jgi:hypothetical protein
MPPGADADRGVAVAPPVAVPVAVAAQLSNLFGDHTFFLDSNGLNIVEPAYSSQAAVQAGRIVNLANWRDANLTSVAPHEPEPTDAIVELGTKH